MKRLISLLCLTIMALSITTVNVPPKTNANADSNGAYYTLHNTYDWWKYTPPTNTYGTQTGDKIYWDDIDVATLHMYSSSYSSNDTLQSGVVLNWSQVNIYINVIYNEQGGYHYHRSFSLTKDGEAYCDKTWQPSDRGSKLIYSENLPQGNYTFTYVGSFTIGATSVITYTYIFDFTIWQTPPSYELKAGGNAVENSSYTNQTITYSASSEKLNGIYVKQPNTSYYTFYSNSTMAIPASSAEGWYYFYAEDIAGNVTPIVSIYLDTTSPNGTIYANGTPISNGSMVDSSFSYLATDSGSGVDYLEYKPPTSSLWLTYTSGTVIPQTSPNGQYDFRAIDKCGNTSTISTIVLSVSEHQYTTQTVPPTCTESGYTRHTCLDCGDYYDTDIVPALGHHFVSTAVSPTCTESGGTKHTCIICGHEYMTDITLPSGHDYDSQIIKEADCEHEGERQHDCENCDDHYSEVIPALGHNYIITDVFKEGNTTKRVWTCTLCGDSYTEDLGNQYENVSSYVELLFSKYSPYMIWIFLATSGVWSIFIGIYIIIAQKNDEKEKARKMLINYAIGLVTIFAILVAAPLLIRGMAALVT